MQNQTIPPPATPIQPPHLPALKTCRADGGGAHKLSKFDDSMKFLQLLLVLVILCIVHQTCAALRGSDEARVLENEADQSKMDANQSKMGADQSKMGAKDMSEGDDMVLRHLEELSTYNRALEEELAAYGGWDQRYLEEVSDP